MIQDPEKSIFEEPVEEIPEETPAESPEEANKPRRITYYASYVVVLGMLICLAITAVHFLQWIFPFWNGNGMVILCTLAAVEAGASHRLIRQLSSAQHQLVYYRITEWILLSIVIKVFAELSLGPANFWSNLRLWGVAFPENIFNGAFFMTLLPVAGIWAIANIFDNDLYLLGNFEEALQEEGIRNISVRNLILRRFLNVGLILVVFAGIPPQTIIAGPLPSAPNTAPAVVMYFILGIVLISLTRYSYLSTHWRLDRVVIPPLIPRRWATYTFILLLGLGLLIFLLPVNYGMGLLDTLNALIGLIAKLFGLLYALIFVVVNYLSRLFFHANNQVLPQPIIPEATQPPPGLLPAEAPSQFWKLLEGIAFWGALAALIIIALRQYILFHRDLADELKHFRPLRWLSLFWKRLTASVKKANQSVGIFVQSSLKRLRSLGRAPVSLNEWDYINPRRLNARQKVIFYYLALIRRADEAGLPRKDGQTPYEYARTLAPKMAEGKEAMEGLTGSFVEARYTRHGIPSEEARRVETLWESARRRLRNIRRLKEKQEKGD